MVVIFPYPNKNYPPGDDHISHPGEGKTKHLRNPDHLRFVLQLFHLERQREKTNRSHQNGEKDFYSQEAIYHMVFLILYIDSNQGSTISAILYWNDFLWNQGSVHMVGTGIGQISHPCCASAIRSHGQHASPIFWGPTSNLFPVDHVACIFRPFGLLLDWNPFLDSPVFVQEVYMYVWIAICL